MSQALVIGEGIKLRGLTAQRSSRFCDWAILDFTVERVCSLMDTVASYFCDRIARLKRAVRIEKVQPSLDWRDEPYTACFRLEFIRLEEAG